MDLLVVILRYTSMGNFHQHTDYFSTLPRNRALQYSPIIVIMVYTNLSVSYSLK